MEMETQVEPRPRRRRKGRTLVGLCLSFVMIFALMSPVEAAPKTQISGNAVPSDCAGDRGAGAIELSGDLTGCLIFFPATFECVEMNGFARVRETGRELFVGRYDGERGKFRTKYDLEATYSSGACADFDAGGFPFEKQLTGGCDHYIRGRSGTFRGMRGLITFFDVIPDPGTSGASNFFYAGYLR